MTPSRVLVIGASSGGVEALNLLLRAIPLPYPHPIAIALHVLAHSAFVPTAFTQRNGLTVKEAEDKEPFSPGTAYFAASDYHLLLEANGVLSLSADEPVQFARPSIDVLFESAAAAYKSKVVGVLLTGANSDGAAGLKAIADAGGTTVVQDPKTARSTAMPRAALDLFQPNEVLGLEEIGQFLSRL